MQGKSNGSAVSARPAPKGKGKGSVGSTHPAVVPGDKGCEGDVSEMRCDM